MSIIKEDFELVRYNSFHIEARARYFTELTSVSDIHHFLSAEISSVSPRFVLGGGSNVLFTGNYNGVILHPAIRGLEIVGDDGKWVLLRVGAGENWDELVEHCVTSEWGGIENLSLIPGSVGASPVQNIGAYGREVGEAIYRVEAISLENGRTIVLGVKDCKFTYRDSIFKNELKDKVIITHITFRLSREHQFVSDYPDLKRELDNYPETTLRSVRQSVISIRRKKLPDPAIIGNAGSFFKNPVVDRTRAESMRRYFPGIRVFELNGGLVKISAAWLIEQCGWKGKRFGKTGTYNKQPLILVNHGGASGGEILTCAKKIQKAVLNKFGINLETEVNIL